MVDLVWCNADGGHLRYQSLAPVAAHVARAGDAVRQRGDRIRESGVPKHPVFAMPDQVAIVAEDRGLPTVDARRPGRDVGDLRLTAVEHIKALDTGRDG